MLRAQTPRIEVPRFPAETPLDAAHAQLLGQELLAFVVEAPVSQTAYDAHQRRSQAIVSAHERIRTDLLHTATERIDDAIGDSGFHYDASATLGINVHTVDRGVCHVALLRDRGTAPTNNGYKLTRQHRQRVEQATTAWHNGHIDTSIIYPIIWDTTLRAGETLVFPIGNNHYRSRPPRGAWHIFTPLTEPRVSLLDMYYESEP